MKILIDPVYTSTPARCASHVKFLRIVQALFETYDDVYVYWLIPEGMSDEDKDKLLKHDHIVYHAIPMVSDRFKMYYRLPVGLEYKVAFNGELWDYDFIFTNKTSLVPLYRLLQFKPTSFRHTWMRQILLLEDMPIMSFKSTIKTAFSRVGDLVCLSGYLASDKTLISAYWEKAEILKQARKYLSPASTKRLSEQVIEAAPHIVTSVGCKSKDMVTGIMDRSIPFTISYSGRMVLSDQVEEVFKVLEDQWVIRGGKGRGKIRTIMTTASRGSARVAPPECVDLVYADRDMFWDIIKNDSAVGLFLSREEDYSMSMLEPLILGLPMAIIRAKHSVASIGEDYPFFVSGVREAYGVINMFYHDYAKYYKIFIEWSRNSLLPLLQSRNSTSVISEALASVKAFHERLEWFNEQETALFDNDVVHAILGETKVGDSFVMEKVIQDLDKKKTFRQPLSKKFVDRESRNNTFGTDWNVFRNVLKVRYNCVDNGVLPGSLKRLK